MNNLEDIVYNNTELGRELVKDLEALHTVLSAPHLTNFEKASYWNLQKDCIMTRYEISGERALINIYKNVNATKY